MFDTIANPVSVSEESRCFELSKRAWTTGSLKIQYNTWRAALLMGCCNSPEWNVSRSHTHTQYLLLKFTKSLQHNESWPTFNHEAVTLLFNVIVMVLPPVCWDFFIWDKQWYDIWWFLWLGLWCFPLFVSPASCNYGLYDVTCVYCTV